MNFLQGVACWGCVGGREDLTYIFFPFYLETGIET